METETQVTTMKLSKPMARLLKNCLGEDKRWHFELVRAQKGTLTAMNGKACVTIGWSGQQLPDGLYSLDGEQLTLPMMPIVETIQPEKGKPYEQWNYPRSLEFIVGERKPVTYPIVPGDTNNSWRVGVLSLLIQTQTYVDVFLFGHILTACECAGPGFNHEGKGQGIVVIRDPKDPVEIKFRYWDRGADSSYVDVDVWLMPFHGGDDKPMTKVSSNHELEARK